MARRKHSPGKPRDPWKRRIGTEFSGLESPRDFLVALGIFVGLVVVGIVIAYLAFG